MHHMNAADYWSGVPPKSWKPFLRATVRPTRRGVTRFLRLITLRKSDAAGASTRRSRSILPSWARITAHPRGGPEPSETDVAQAFRDFVFLIVGLGASLGGMEIRAYTFDGSKLTPVQLLVVD